MARTTAVDRKSQKAEDETDKVRPLIQHVLSIHKGGDAAKETTLALLLEHLHWQRQSGIREAAQFLREATVSSMPRTKHIAGSLAFYLDEWARKNEAGRG